MTFFTARLDSFLPPSANTLTGEAGSCSSDCARPANQGSFGNGGEPARQQVPAAAPARPALCPGAAPRWALGHRLGTTPQGSTKSPLKSTGQNGSAGTHDCPFIYAFQMFWGCRRGFVVLSATRQPPQHGTLQRASSAAESCGQSQRGRKRSCVWRCFTR